jgi:cobalt transporter subunit CbtB
MSNTTAARLHGAVARPIVTAQTATVLLLVVSAFLALVVYYFVGLDEGATSVFGKSMIVHEFFHDGRHFLGFPCH